MSFSCDGRMKVLSLFSGIGAFEKSLENVNIDFETVGTSEIDKDAMVSYAAIHCGLDNETIESYNYPEPSVMADYLLSRNIGYDVKENKPYDWYKLSKRKNKKGIERYYLASILSKNHGDITKINLDSLPSSDLITHGSPCQDFSVAGKGQGGDIGTQTRSSLMWNSVEIIRRCKPKYVVWENVKNVLSKNHRHNFDKYIETLEEIGYKNYYKVLNAKDCGIPQNRERIFVISIRNDIEQEFELPLPFDNGIRLKDLLEDVVDEKFYISNEKVEQLLTRLKNNRKGQHPTQLFTSTSALGSRESRGTGWKEEVGTLCARDYKDPKCVCVPCLTPDRIEKRQNGRRFKEDGEPSFTLTGQDRHGVLQVGNIVDTGSWDNPQRGRIYNPEGCCPSLNTVGGGGLEPKILTPRRTEYGKTIRKQYEAGEIQESRHNMTELQPRNDEISNTLTSVQKDNLLYCDYRIRKLTPLECFRLMGFSDEDFNKCVEAGISNSQLYKQAGNSIVVDVLERIFERLLGDCK